jgi:hypothetical protein
MKISHEIMENQENALAEKAQEFREQGAEIYR